MCKKYCFIATALMILLAWNPFLEADEFDPSTEPIARRPIEILLNGDKNSQEYIDLNAIIQQFSTKKQRFGLAFQGEGELNPWNLENVMLDVWFHNPTPDELQLLAKLEPEAIRIYKLPEAAIPCLKRFTKCRYLFLADNCIKTETGERPLKGAELNFLTAMPQLEEFYLGYPSLSLGKLAVDEETSCIVSAKDVGVFQGLKNLKQLYLEGCDPKAVISITSFCPQLRSLVIQSLCLPGIKNYNEYFHHYDMLPVMKAIAQLKELKILVLGNVPWMELADLKPLMSKSDRQYVHLQGSYTPMSEDTYHASCCCATRYKVSNRCRVFGYPIDHLGIKEIILPDQKDSEARKTDFNKDILEDYTEDISTIEVSASDLNEMEVYMKDIW